MIYVGEPDRETCLGLIIPGKKYAFEVESAESEISYGSNIDLEKLDGIKDASGEFTGYYDKDDDNGEDSPSPSGA